MWRQLVRRMLVRLRFIPSPDLVGLTMNRHPTPAELKPGVLIVVQDEDRLKWACFRCPGGCGEKLQLSLRPSRRPRWTIGVDWLLRPTIEPSINQLNHCRCHFWIKSGSVEWCGPDDREPDTGLLEDLKQ